MSAARTLALSFTITLIVLLTVALTHDLLAPRGSGLPDLIRLAFGIYPRAGLFR
jgi:hypothetical protein